MKTLTQKAAAAMLTLSLAATIVPVAAYAQDAPDATESQRATAEQTATANNQLPAAQIAQEGVDFSAALQDSSSLLDLPTQAENDEYIASLPANVRSTSYGFFVKNATVKAFLTAGGILEQCDGSGYMTYVGESDDTTSLENLKKAAAYIRQCNAIRAAEGVDPTSGKALQPLQVSAILLAVSEVQTNVSSVTCNHSQIWQVAENLAWGMSDPFSETKGWMSEKALYQQLIAEHPEYKGLSHNELSSKDPQAAASVGHYLNIVCADYVYTGFAVTDRDSNAYGTTYGQVFYYGSDAELQEGAMTVDQLDSKIAAYEASIGVSSGNGSASEFTGNKDSSNNASTNVDAVGATDFAKRLYSAILDRQPDQNGLNDQVNALINGTSPAQIALNYFNSAEYVGKNESGSQTIDRVYQVMFGRDSDQEGKTFWQRRLDVGMSVDAVVAGFSQADEYKQYFASMGLDASTIEPTQSRDKNFGATSFAYRMYTKVLGRTAEATGLDTQSQALIDGVAAWQIAVNYFDSAEFKAKNLSNAEIVNVAYQAILGRSAEETAADTEGRAYWEARLAKEGLVNVVKGFCQSNEFEALCQCCNLTSGMR